MKLTITYNISKLHPQGTHAYEQEVEETSSRCPACSHSFLWADSGAGDYYLGPKFYCPQCFWTGYVQASCFANPNGTGTDDQVIRAIRVLK